MKPKSGSVLPSSPSVEQPVENVIMASPDVKTVIRNDDGIFNEMELRATEMYRRRTKGLEFDPLIIAVIIETIMTVLKQCTSAEQVKKVLEKPVLARVIIRHAMNREDRSRDIVETIFDMGTVASVEELTRAREMTL